MCACVHAHIRCYPKVQIISPKWLLCLSSKMLVSVSLKPCNSLDISYILQNHSNRELQTVYHFFFFFVFPKEAISHLKFPDFWGNISHISTLRAHWNLALKPHYQEQNIYVKQVCLKILLQKQQSERGIISVIKKRISYAW